VKALPKRLCIGIGGHFGPCYGVTLKKGRLTYTYSSGDSSSREPEPPLEWPLKPYPQPEEIRVSPQQWRNFRRTLDRLTSGAGNVITWILPSATGPIGPLKSFTRIDRSSRVAITAFRAGTEERSPLPRMERTIPSRNSVAPSPA